MIIIRTLLSRLRTVRDYTINYFSYGILGSRIRISASSLCQLACPACDRHKIETEAIGCGYLTLANFERFIDAHPTFRRVELSHQGEPFLNPELAAIIGHAHKKKVTISIANGANLNTVSDETLEALVKFQVRVLNVSIDGACDETYKIYRRGGDFHRVIEHIEKINAYKARYHSQYPELGWLFILFGHNENEVEAARTLAKKLNMQFHLKFNWSKTYAPLINPDIARREFGAADRWEYRKISDHKRYMFSCRQLWSNVQINWDGAVLGCCSNKTRRFGNAFTDGLRACLKSRPYQACLRLVTGQTSLPSDRSADPCSQCHKFAEIQEGGAYFEPPTFFKFVGLCRDALLGKQ